MALLVAMCAWDKQVSNFNSFGADSWAFVFIFLCVLCVCMRAPFFLPFLFFILPPLLSTRTAWLFSKMVHIIKMKSIRNMNICHIVLLTWAPETEVHNGKYAATFTGIVCSVSLSLIVVRIVSCPELALKRCVCVNGCLKVNNMPYTTFGCRMLFLQHSTPTSR